MQVSHSRDTGIVADDNTLHDPQISNRIHGPGVPPHHLPLKVGATIMLIKYVDACHAHCNETRYMITSLTKNLMEAQNSARRETPKKS